MFLNLYQVRHRKQMLIFAWCAEEKRESCLWPEAASRGFGHPTMPGFHDWQESHMFAHPKTVHGIPRGKLCSVPCIYRISFQIVWMIEINPKIFVEGGRKFFKNSSNQIDQKQRSSSTQNAKITEMQNRAVVAARPSALAEDPQGHESSSVIPCLRMWEWTWVHSPHEN